MLVHTFYNTWANIHGLTQLKHTYDWPVIHNEPGEFVLYQCPKYPHILLVKHLIPLSLVCSSVKATVLDYIADSPFNSFYLYRPFNLRGNILRDDPKLLGYIFLDEYVCKEGSILEHSSKNLIHQKGITKCGKLAYLNFYHLFYWYKLLPRDLLKDIRYLVFQKLADLELYN